MADDFVTNAGAGGKTFRSLDDGTRQWPASVVSWVTVLGDPDTVVTPVAAALADGASPVTLTFGSATFVYNGTNWSMLRGDAANGADVDVTRLPTGSLAGATAKTADYDTGAGTDTVVMCGIALPASGGAVAGGTASNPVRVDPTGTTTQPVSGSVSITGEVDVTPASPSASVYLPIRVTNGSSFVDPTQIRALTASDEVSLAEVNAMDFDTGAGTQNQAVVGVLLPASGGAVIGGTATNPFRVDVTGSTTQPISGTVTVQQTTHDNLNLNANLQVSNADATMTNPAPARLSDGSAFYDAAKTGQLPAALTGSGNLKSAIMEALPTGSNVVGGVTQSGTWTVQPGNTQNTTEWLVSDRPQTAGGLSMHKTISAASTNATSVKASAGQVYSVQCFNKNAAPRYLKLYNKASAPTVGTDTPVKVLMIPGNTAGAGFVHSWEKGLAFGTGIAFALTTGIDDSDTGAVGASEIAANLDYK